MEKQPRIRQILIDALREDSRIPYDGLANYIQHWCSVSTICLWLITIDGYTMYSERIITIIYTIHRKTFDLFKDSVRKLGERDGGSIYGLALMEMVLGDDTT